MGSMRNSWQIAGYSLSMQRDQARTWVAFVLMALLGVQSVGKWYTLSRLLEGPVQLAEPMVIWFNGWYTPFLLFAALFLVLCDAPFYTRFDSWMLTRASRKSWYIGKCLEIVGICICYYRGDYGDWPVDESAGQLRGQPLELGDAADDPGGIPAH